MAGGLGQTAPSAAVQVKVEVEEDLYSYTPANNGAGPLWCSGSSCLVRIGENVFASGIETIPDAKPLNNCRWMLFGRGPAGWKLITKDPSGRTREPCPLVGFYSGALFLSANPTLSPNESGGGPAEPEILEFSSANPDAGFQRLAPKWEGTPAFTEHSYRSFAADGKNGELILFQNIGYTHAEWTFRDRNGAWAARGRLAWPPISEKTNLKPIRVCYPDVALDNRAVYFCGVSDIIEPNPEWRAFKRQLTGQEWDYDFRRLFFTWTPDITRAAFGKWIEIASREETCGWISPGDLWVAPDRTVHLLWTERALDERLRPKFFPDAKQSHALNYAQVRQGKVVSRRTLVISEEDRPGVVPSVGRFHVTPANRLWVVYYASGRETTGEAVSENRVMELSLDGEVLRSATVPLKRPFTSFFTATPRAGSPPSESIEFLGHRAGSSSTISYAKVRLLTGDTR